MGKKAKVATSFQSAEQSTLQKIRALEQDFKTFQEQLHQIPEILGIDAILEPTYSSLVKNDIELRPKFSGRCKWAIGWLLGKLKGDDAFTSVRAWTLLGNLISIIPVSALSSSLATHDFFSILLKAFEIGYPAEREDSPQPTGTAQELDPKTEVPNRQATTINGTSQDDSTTKKRKRVADYQSSEAKKKSKPDDQSENSTLDGCFPSKSHLVDLFVAITTCLEKLVNLTIQTVGSKTLHSIRHLQSILRIDATDAARLLGSWLRAVCLMTQEEKRIKEMRLFYKDRGSWSSGILYIWNNKSDDLSDDLALSLRIFTGYCLLPATRLLYRKADPFTNDSNKALIAPTIQLAEQLISRHLLAQARAEFHVSPHNSRFNNDHQAKIQNLQNLMRPLRENLSFENDDRDGEAHNQVMASIPLLFDLIIRSTPLKSPKQKITESKWIEACFLILSECLGFQILEEKENSDPRLINRLQYLEELLRVAVNHEIRVNSELLIRLLSYSGISKTDKTQIRWKLVEKVMSMDADIFLGDFLSGDLFNSITESAWTLNGPRSHGQNEDALASMIRDNLVLPLMGQYTKARNLAGFLTRWKSSIMSFEKISKPKSDIDALGSSINLQSVWEDAALSKKLRDLLESSLTSRQILSFLEDLVKEIRQNIHDLGEVANDSINASLTVATAVLYALSTDQILTEIHSIAKEIFFLCITIISQNHAELFKVNMLSWRCMLQAYRVWSYALNGAEIVAAIEAEAPKLCDLADATLNLTFQSTLWGEILVGGESFACMARISTDLYQLHKEYDKIHSYNRDMIRYLKKNFACKGSRKDILDDARIHLISVLLAECPTTLLSINHLERRDLLRNMLEFATQADKIHSSRFFSDWQCLVLAALKIDDLEISQDIFMQVATSFKSCHSSIRPQMGALLLQMPEGILTYLKSDDITALAIEQGTNRWPVHDYHLLLKLLCRFAKSDWESDSLTPNSNDLWDLARLLDANLNQMNLASLKIFCQLASAEFERLLSSFDDAAAKEQFSSIFEKALNLVKTTKTYVGRPSQLKAIDMILCMSHDKIAKCVANFSIIEYTNIQELHCATLYKDLASLDFTGSVFKSSITLVELDTILESLAHIDSNILAEDLKFQSQMTAVLKYTDESSNIPEMNASQAMIYIIMVRIETKIRQISGQAPNLNHLIAALHCTHAKSLKEIDEGAEEEELNFQSTNVLPFDVALAHEIHLLRSFRKSIDLLDEPTKTSLTLELLGDKSEGLPSIAELRLLQEIVNSLDEKFSAAQSLLPRMALFLRKLTNFEQFIILTNIIDAIFHSKARLVTQFGVDTILSEAHRFCSSQGPKLLPKHGGFIFVRICKLVLTILTSFRRNIQDRHHLVIPILQVLLRCLFTYQPSHVFKMGYLPWMAHVDFKLTSKQVSLYVRILTTFCEPSPSAIKYRSKNIALELTDQTRKAREIAGRFAPFLITEFCYIQLRGAKLGPGIREALMPGIYALFGAAEMAKGILETTNAGLNGAGRAVFKSLYEDYKRIGKWKDG